MTFDPWIQRRRPADDLDLLRLQRIQRDGAAPGLAAEVSGTDAVFEDQHAFAVEPADDGTARPVTEALRSDSRGAFQHLAERPPAFVLEVEARDHVHRTERLERAALEHRVGDDDVFVAPVPRFQQNRLGDLEGRFVRVHDEDADSAQEAGIHVEGKQCMSVGVLLRADDQLEPSVVVGVGDLVPFEEDHLRGVRGFAGIGHQHGPRNRGSGRRRRRAAEALRSGGRREPPNRIAGAGATRLPLADPHPHSPRSRPWWRPANQRLADRPAGANPEPVHRSHAQPSSSRSIQPEYAQWPRGTPSGWTRRSAVQFLNGPQTRPRDLPPRSRPRSAGCLGRSRHRIHDHFEGAAPRQDLFERVGLPTVNREVVLLANLHHPVREPAFVPLRHPFRGVPVHLLVPFDAGGCQRQVERIFSKLAFSAGARRAQATVVCLLTAQRCARCRFDSSSQTTLRCTGCRFRRGPR